ncbi:MAG: ADP-ribosylglycohydrolase family protein [Candidatus Hydrogenedentota bacterium]
MDKKERFTGCLLGQCLGDALGFIVEGEPRTTCKEYVDTCLRARRIPEGRRGPFTFGQYSDDSQLARELMQSYVDRRRFDPADYARRIAAIFAERRIVGGGGATTIAAHRLIQGMPWQEAGTPPPSAGNGTAMRAAPIGLIFFEDPTRLAQAAHDQGRITHTDPRCSAGSVIIAGVVAHVVRDGRVQRDQLLGELEELAAPHGDDFVNGLTQMAEWLALSPDEAHRPIASAGQEERAWPGITPFVVPSVLWSLYAFLRTPEDYWETICTAIACGGDVDTTAAMAGAMSGTCNGLSALPSAYLEYLHDRDTWHYDALVRLAHDAWAVKRRDL